MAETLVCHEFAWDGDGPVLGSGLPLPATHVQWSTQSGERSDQAEWEAWFALENGVTAVLLANPETAGVLAYAPNDEGEPWYVLNETAGALVQPEGCLGHHCPGCWHGNAYEDPGDREELLAILRRWSNKPLHRPIVGGGSQGSADGGEQP